MQTPTTLVQRKMRALALSWGRQHRQHCHPDPHLNPLHPKPPPAQTLGPAGRGLQGVKDREPRGGGEWGIQCGGCGANGGRGNRRDTSSPMAWQCHLCALHPKALS